MFSKNGIQQVEDIGAGGGTPVTIADGSDVNSGTTTDAASTSDSNGTLSSKLRGLVKWAYERMPASLGQKLSFASFPVVIASNQSPIDVNASLTIPNPLPVSGTSVVSAGNSTTALLAAAATFTGVFEDVLGYAAVIIVAISDAQATVDSVFFDWSTNGVDVDYTTIGNYRVNGSGVSFELPVATRYFRIRWKSQQIQTYFRLKTIYQYNEASDRILTTVSDIAPSQVVVIGTDRGGSGADTGVHPLTSKVGAYGDTAGGGVYGAVVRAMPGPRDTSQFLINDAGYFPTGGVFDDTPPADLLPAIGGVARITKQRALHVNLRNSTGTEVAPLTDTQLRSTPVPISAASLPLPTGAATEATLATRASQATLASVLAQLDVALSTRSSEATLVSVLGKLDVALSTRLAEATFTTRINTLGQKTSANSTPVVLPSDQTVAISAVALPLPTGAATSALQTQPGVDIGDVTVNNANGAAAVNIQDGGNSITVDGSVTANAGTNLNTSLLALEAGGNLASILTKLSDKLQLTGITDGTNAAVATDVASPSDSARGLDVRPIFSFPVNTSLTNLTIAGDTATITVNGSSLIIINIQNALADATFIIEQKLKTATWTPIAALNVATGLTTSGVISILTSSTSTDYLIAVMGGSGNTIRVRLVSINGVALGVACYTQSLGGAIITQPLPAGLNNIGKVTVTGLLNDQGAVIAGAVGPLVQGIVSDVPESYLPDYIRPLSLTTDGRLRVATAPSNVDLDFFDDLNPFGDANVFGISSDSPYKQSSPYS